MVTTEHFLSSVIGGVCLRAVTPWVRVALLLVSSKFKGPGRTGSSEWNNQGQKAESHHGVEMQISHGNTNPPSPKAGREGA